METNEKYHLPVMGAEVVELLSHDSDGILVDGTSGTGGHTRLLIEKLTGNGKVIACDLDSRMLEIAKRRNREVSEKVRFIKCGYHQIADHLLPEEKPLSGYFLDLGINSLHLDGSLGFAFKTDNPLDMRFSRETTLTAADIITTYPAGELRKILKQYGELKQAKSLVPHRSGSTRNRWCDDTGLDVVQRIPRCQVRLIGDIHAQGRACLCPVKSVLDPHQDFWF